MLGGLGVEEAGGFECVGEEVGDDVGVGPADLVGVFELVDHAFPFLFAVFGDNGLFAVVAAEVHAHAGGVGFGVELGADHGVGKADGHDRSFEGDMGPFFFDGQDAAAHIGDLLVVGLNHLVAAAVDSVEGVIESCEYRFFHGAFEEMHGEYAEGGGASAGDFRDSVATADELEGVADEQDMFMIGRFGVEVVCFNPAKPAEISFFPGGMDGIEGASGAAA